MFTKATLVAAACSLLPLASAQISEGFEDGWDETAWPVYAPDCQQGSTVALDTSEAHTGSNSIKVTGAGGYCGHAFFGTTDIPEGDVYIRTFMKATTALTDSHVTFITMPDSAQGTNKHLRIGGQSKILMYNRESDDATLPDLSPQGIATSEALPTGDWVCFESHVGADGTIETWVDDEAVTGLTAGPGSDNPNGAQWERGLILPKLEGVYFGWESYGGDANTILFADAIPQSQQLPPYLACARHEKLDVSTPQVAM